MELHRYFAAVKCQPFNLRFRFLKNFPLFAFYLYLLFNKNVTLSCLSFITIIDKSRHAML